MTVLQDLQHSGITLHPHDLTRERFAPYDVAIPNLGYGDVKLSLYFLDDLTAEAPNADFYITRLYVPDIRDYQWAVFMTPRAWSRLATGHSPLHVVTAVAEAAERFPEIVQVKIEYLNWIVAAYKTWKTLVLHQ